MTNPVKTVADQVKTAAKKPQVKAPQPPKNMVTRVAGNIRTSLDKRGKRKEIGF